MDNYTKTRDQEKSRKSLCTRIYIALLKEPGKLSVKKIEKYSKKFVFWRENVSCVKKLCF